MNAMRFAGVLALAAGVVLILGGIGFIARDEALGWLVAAGGTVPTAFAYWALREKNPTRERKHPATPGT